MNHTLSTKLSLLLFSLLLVLTGCSSNAEKDQAGKASDEPITLKVYQYGANLADDEFQQYFIEPVKKKYPNITLELVRSGEATTPEELLTSGTFPDLIYTSDKSIGNLKRLGVATDLSDLAKKHNLDLNRFDPTIIETIRLLGEKDELLGIPFSQNVGVMVYNKDLFDKFGVPHPTDGMDWDQVISLGRQLTKKVDGVQYIGFDPMNINTLGQGLALPYIDPNTNKAAINNENWQRVFKTVKEAYDVPGFIGPNNKIRYGVKSFFQEKNLAILVQWLNSVLINGTGAAKPDFNWDIASLPNFKEAVGTNREVDAHLLMLSKLSKHQDAAFNVLSVISSDEVQTAISRKGRISVLTNPEIQKSYAADLPEFTGKNIAGIFKSKPRKTHVPVTDYDKIVWETINNSANELATGSKDINTLLRETEEKANAAIQEAQVK